MSLSSSQLISFTPGEHNPPGSETGVERLGITLAVRLNGLVMSTATGSRLDAALSIPFAPRGLCDRLQFLGITPVGHAPLVLTGAGYWGSSCGYEDPSADVWLIYSDEDYSADPGPLLVIDLPAENVSSYFEWPDPDVAWDPPLSTEEADSAPALGLELTGFHGLDPLADDGVRLPMELVISELGQTAETLLAEKRYEDAPAFSGSGQSINCDPVPIWQVTARDIMAAVSAPGEYALTWRIYKGSGTMTYALTCDGDTVGDPYEDTRVTGPGGGAGIIQTTELVAATVKVTTKPWPFYLYTPPFALGPIEVATNADLQACEQRMIGDRDWRGIDENGAPIILSWFATGNDIFCAGRVLHNAPGGRVLAAALRQVQPVPIDPPTDPPRFARPGGEAVIYLHAPNGSSDLVLYQRLLYRGSSAVEAARFPIPGGVSASALRAGISPAGDHLFVLILPSIPSLGSEYAELRNGSLFEAPIGEDGGLVTLGALSTVYAPPDMPAEFSAEAGGTGLVPIHVTVAGHLEGVVQNGSVSSTYSAVYPLLFGARYSDDGTLQWSSAVLSISATYNSSRTGQVDDVLVTPLGEPPLTVCRVAGAPAIHHVITSQNQWDVTEAWTIAIDGAAVDRYSYHSVANSPEIKVYTTTIPTIQCLISSPPDVWGDVIHYGPETYANDVAVTPADTDQTIVTRQRLGLKRSDQGIHGVLTLDLAGESGSDSSAIHYDRIIVRDGEAEVLRIDSPAIPERAALEWRVPRPMPSTAEAILELRECLLWNLAMMVGRESTVVPGRWFTYPCRSCVAPDGSQRLTKLDYATNDATQTARSAVSLIDSPLPSLTNVAAYGPYVITPRACLIKQDPDARKPAGTNPDAPTAADLIAAHNSYRADRGLSQLVQSPQLTSAITAHINWLVAQGRTVQHEGEDGSNPLDRALAAGYSGATVAVGENLALGFSEIEAVMLGWDGSPPHHANLVDPEWEDIGVSIVESAGVGYWWGVLFGVRT